MKQFYSSNEYSPESSCFPVLFVILHIHTRSHTQRVKRPQVCTQVHPLYGQRGNYGQIRRCRKIFVLGKLPTTKKILFGGQKCSEDRSDDLRPADETVGGQMCLL